MRHNSKVRMNRLFGDGRCLDVAIDHGVCNEPSFLNGLEDMAGRGRRRWSTAAPDAIQMNYGQADLLQDVPGKDKPALVMRIDMGNPYNRMRHRDMWAVLQNEAEPLIGAIEMDAACVVVNLFMLPDEPDLFRQCVAEHLPRAGRLRQIRHAADDRAAGHAAGHRAGRLHGRWRCRQDRHADAACPRDGRRYRQGRPDRPMPRISTGSSRRRAARFWCAAAARRICAPCSTNRRP